MSWVPFNFFGKTDLKFFNGTFYNPTQICFMTLDDLKNNNTPSFCFCLGSSRIICNSLQPYSIKINDEQANMDWRGYNGYYRYISKNYVLYHSSTLWVVIPKNTDSNTTLYTWPGCEPQTFQYSDINGDTFTVGTACYTANALSLNDNTFNGINQFNGQTITVTIKEKFFKSIGKGLYEYTLEAGVYRFFGTPYFISSIGTLYKTSNYASDGVVLISEEGNIQINRKGMKYIYGEENSAEGWWQCEIPDKRTSFTLNFKTLTENQSKKSDINVIYSGVSQNFSTNSVRVFYGDFSRWS